MHINRESIIDAAISLLDTYGLGDVTMRRVASSLGVAPGALYWHIANKQALIAALAEYIISPVSGESLEAISLNLRDLLLARRDGARASPEMLDAEIARFPAFQLAGRFDMSAYERYLRGELEDYTLPDELLAEALRTLPSVG